MASLKEFLETQWPNIMTVVVVFLTLIMLFNMFGVNFNPVEDKHVEKVVTIESFETKTDVESVKKVKSHDPSELHGTCTKLSNKNCKEASYCVLLNNKKCVGGNASGPTFLTNNGEKVDYDYYYYQDKCFGKCPK